MCPFGDERSLDVESIIEASIGGILQFDVLEDKDRAICSSTAVEE